jgi:hypothetical protein
MKRFSFVRILITVPLLLLTQSCYMFCLFKDDSVIEEKISSLIENSIYGTDQGSSEGEGELEFNSSLENDAVNS